MRTWKTTAVLALAALFVTAASLGAHAAAPIATVSEATVAVVVIPEAASKPTRPTLTATVIPEVRPIEVPTPRVEIEPVQVEPEVDPELELWLDGCPACGRG